jgi:hypothetical protein
MMDGIEPHQSDDDEIDRDDEVEQPRHQQDENTADQSDKRRDMGGGDDHEKPLGFQVVKSEGPRNAYSTREAPFGSSTSR